MPETNLGALLDSAMNEVQPRRRTKSERKVAHRKQGAVSPSPAANQPSPTVDALLALVESYASHRSVNINGPDPAFDEVKASLQGALRVLVAQATSKAQLQLPDRKMQDRMDPGDTEERYAKHEGHVEGWNECLDEISRLNGNPSVAQPLAGAQTTPAARDLPEPACYLLNGTSKLAETCESSYAVLVRTPEGPGERMPIFTGDQLRQLLSGGRRETHKLVPLQLPQDVQHAAAIWGSMGMKKTYAELWQFMLSKLPS